MRLNAKISLLCLTTGLAALPAVWADDAPPPPPPPPANGGPGGGGPPEPGQGGQFRERMKERQEKLMQDLNLTADQQAKWKSITMEEMKARKALRNDPSVPDDQRRQKMMETMKTFEEQRRAILTPEQQKKYDELRANMRGNWGRRGGPPGQNPPPPPPPPANGT